MVAAFMMLAVAGGFVFDTMMPEESDRLMASILGSSSETETPMSPEVPTEETTQGDDVTNLITDASENIDDTSMLTEDDTAIETPVDPGNTPATDIEEPETEDNTAETPVVPSMTIDQARTSLNLLSQDSKKLLTTALKLDEKQASTLLYKVFKDSSNLLDALANTSDISTIADIEVQIANLQTNLNQATIILNVASNNAQSQ